MGEIQSETRFLWKLILDILHTPIILVLILFGKKEWKDLMRPFRDTKSFIFEPKITITIIIINIICFFGSLFLSDEAFESLVNYPSDLFSFRLYTLITAGFLHADLGHLLGNMLVIFIFGRVVERKLKAGKTLLIYIGALFISNFFSSIVHLAMGEDIGVIGASGALMGLVSAAILLDPFYLTYELLIPLPVMVIGWLTIYGDISGILSPVADNIAHFAHLGGFLSVALLGYALGIEDRSKLKKGLIINIVSFVVAVFVYVYFLQ